MAMSCIHRRCRFRAGPSVHLFACMDLADLARSNQRAASAADDWTRLPDESFIDVCGALTSTGERFSFKKVSFRRLALQPCYQWPGCCGENFWVHDRPWYPFRGRGVSLIVALSHLLKSQVRYQGVELHAGRIRRRGDLAPGTGQLPPDCALLRACTRAVYLPVTALRRPFLYCMTQR